MSNAGRSWSDGVLLGVLGMTGFSGTLAATRAAVADFSPLEITAVRIVVAAALGAIALVILRRTEPPAGRLIPSLLWMGLGLAVGFPFFVALALETAPAVHGAVAIGLAPAATALFAVLRLGERPPLAFWIACAVGFGGVLYYAIDAGGGRLVPADGWLFIALLCVGSAYVEGGRISGELGGTVTLSWAMIFLAPPAVIILLWRGVEATPSSVSTAGLIGLAYVSVISMFLASVFWYRGLAAGGVARIGQINLILPLVALVWSALFLGEEITATAVVCSVVVFAAMIVCLKSRVR